MVSCEKPWSSCAAFWVPRDCIDEGATLGLLWSRSRLTVQLWCGFPLTFLIVPGPAVAGSGSHHSLLATMATQGHLLRPTTTCAMAQWWFVAEAASSRSEDHQPCSWDASRFSWVSVSHR